MKAKFVNEFHKTSDPLGALNMGFYKTWRDIYDKKPIINIVAHLQHRIHDKLILTYFASCNYNLYNDKKIYDAIYFEEMGIAYYMWIDDIKNRNNAKIYSVNDLALRPSTYFGGIDEMALYDNPSVFNKGIIDVLTKEGNIGAKKILDEYARDWWEEDLPFLNVIEDWLNSGKYKVMKIFMSCNIIKN